MDDARSRATEGSAPARPPTYRAVVRDGYGPASVLAIRDVPRPDLGPDGVLVRVRASSVNAVDWHMLRGEPYVVRLSEGIRRPRNPRLGVDVAGVVEAVGDQVTALAPGDQVFGGRNGAFAELVLGRERNFVRKPAGIPFEAAAAVPVAGTTALQAIRDRAAVTAGHRVLVTGANGGVGTFAIQIARAAGAVVTASARPGHGDLLRALGADEVVDASTDDITRSPRRFDAIIEIAGRHSLLALRRILAPSGRLIIVGAPPGNWLAPVRRPLLGAVLSRLGTRRFVPFVARLGHADLDVLSNMLSSGAIRPVIDSAYPLEGTAAALERIEAHGLDGKVVITV